MNNSTFSNFIIEYIRSLKERSSYSEKMKSYTYGFDWIIYQIALKKGWIPQRLPFFRDERIVHKTEAEFGIDLAFVSPNHQELYIFVLKDEKLNNANWNKKNFESDLTNASTPDLNVPEFAKLEEISIILAYNKDEDQTGIKLFANLTDSLKKTRNRNDIATNYTRWNLTTIVDEVQNNLLTPALMPQNLYGLFQYLCSQIDDFKYGSLEWESQLLPNWKRFLKIALEGKMKEEKILLIPTALIILFTCKKDSPSSYPGWIDLVEWAMLSLWNIYRTQPKKAIKGMIIQIYTNFYIIELEKYIFTVSDAFTSLHGFTTPYTGLSINSLNDAYIAYWHIARLGVFTIATQEFRFHEKDEDHEKFLAHVANRSANLLVQCLHNNPAAHRPLIDLHHIQLFLIWLILWQVGRENDIIEWLSQLEAYLLVRRSGRLANLPFMEGRNRMDLVAEWAATGRRPYNYVDESSYLLLMVMELCFSLNEQDRTVLINRYMQRIIKGIGDDGKSFIGKGKVIDLIGWIQPDDWEKRILSESVLDGVGITTNNFEDPGDDELTLVERIRKFVDESQKLEDHRISREVPSSVYILACIKNNSPLPPSFWRNTIFKEEKGE